MRADKLQIEQPSMQELSKLQVQFSTNGIQLQWYILIGSQEKIKIIFSIFVRFSVKFMSFRP